MSRIDRIYRIHEILLNARHPVPMRRLTDRITNRPVVGKDITILMTPG